MGCSSTFLRFHEPDVATAQRHYFPGGAHPRWTAVAGRPTSSVERCLTGSPAYVRGVVPVLPMLNPGTQTMTTHKGSCHCGIISFELEGDFDHALACNCSICSRRGSPLWFASPDRFRLGKPEPAAATYTFYRHAVKHRFCPTCGIHVFAEGADAQGSPFVAVNIRCIDDLDLSAVPVREFDGRAL
jgi:hypothetical protein